MSAHPERTQQQEVVKPDHVLDDGARVPFAARGRSRPAILRHCGRNSAELVACAPMTRNQLLHVVIMACCSFRRMADWSTIASLATAGGTLVLAVATFASTRTSNRASRLAEQALLTRIRPLLLTARFEDPPEKITWMDQHITKAPGGYGMFEEDNGVLYLAIALRNVGTGLAVLHGWRVSDDLYNGAETDEARYRRLNRDLYIASGMNGFWQGAVREADDPDRQQIRELFDKRERFAVDLLYGDQEGGQRTVTRFGYTPIRENEWLCATSRHWFLDRDDPR